MAVAIAIGLTLVSSLYAYVLNKRQVREWYTPDRTWITVVIGDGLIIIALGVAVLTDQIAWGAWWIVFGYTCAAGAPIIIWQLYRRWKRRQRAAQVLERE